MRPTGAGSPRARHSGPLVRPTPARTSISRSAPCPSNVSAAAAVDQPGDAVAEQLGSPAVGQPGVRVAAQDGDEVGPGGQQRGVDAGVPGDLADPRRHQRDRRPHRAVELVDAVGRRRRLGRPCAAATAASSSRPIRPRRCRSSTPRAWASSSSVVGWRWAMPRMARSGSTWRTGMSLAAASRSRHAATAWATARARDRSERASFSFIHAASGVDRAGRAGCAAPRRPPRPTPVRPSSAELGDRAGPAAASSDATSAAAYACWAVGQRPAQPVGEAVALGRRDAELALQQRRPATACRSRRSRPRPGCRTGARGTAPTAWVSTSRSCCAAWATASAGDSNSLAQRPRVDRQRVDERQLTGVADVVRPRRAARAPAAGSTSARGGTRCRSRSAARRPARR